MNDTFDIDIQLTRKNDITLKALDFFTKNDKAQFTIENACMAIELGKEDFYTLYRSMDDFLIQLIAYYTRTIQDLTDPILTDIKVDPLRRIENLYSHYVDYYVNRNAFPFSTIASRIISSAESEEVRQAACDVINLVKHSHYNCLLEAKKIGMIDFKVDIDKLSEFIIYAWEGTLHCFYATGSIKSLFTFNTILKNNLLKTK